MDQEGNGLDNPRPMEDADIETSSDAYAARFSGTVGAWFLDVQARCTLDLLAGLPKGARLLDVGGGHAQLTPALVEGGYETVIVGSGPEAGRRLGPYLGSGRVRFEVADLLRLPYEDGSFDAALSFRLLPHLSDWHRLIFELCRVARRCVVVDYPSVRSVNVLADRMFGMKKRVEKNTRPFTLFHPSEIRGAFIAMGFGVTGARPQFLFPMVVHRMLRSSVIARGLEAPGRWLHLTSRFGSPIIVRADRRA